MTIETDFGHAVDVVVGCGIVLDIGAAIGIYGCISVCPRWF